MPPRNHDASRANRSALWGSASSCELGVVTMLQGFGELNEKCSLLMVDME